MNQQSPDPREVHQQDMADAATRDQQAWDMNVASTKAQLEGTMAGANYAQAKARFWGSLTTLVSTASTLLWVTWVIVVVTLLVERVR